MNFRPPRVPPRCNELCGEYLCQRPYGHTGTHFMELPDGSIEWGDFPPGFFDDFDLFIARSKPS